MDLSPLAKRVFTELLERRTGQQLADNRLWRIETALAPLLRARHLDSVETLASMLAGGRDAPLGEDVAEALLNNETFFFRDPPAFQQLTGPVFEQLREGRDARRTLRIWCAGCSTGQEPYSIAIALAEQGTIWAGWKIDIIATDVARSAIDRAREGLYSQFEIQRGLPVRQMLRWFESENEQWRAAQELRNRISFKVQNLLDPPPPGGFDIILCRNVLLYFSADTRATVFDQFRRVIAPDGVLMLGAGETVLGQTRAFESDPVLRGLYRPMPDPVSRAA
jgi:chemotaxis protein methyltransferase CheR